MADQLLKRLETHRWDSSTLLTQKGALSVVKLRKAAKDLGLITKPTDEKLDILRAIVRHISDSSSPRSRSGSSPPSRKTVSSASPKPASHRSGSAGKRSTPAKSPKRKTPVKTAEGAKFDKIHEMATPVALTYLDEAIECGKLKEFLSRWLPTHPSLPDKDAQRVLGLHRKPRSSNEVLRAYASSKEDCEGSYRTLQELQRAMDCNQRMETVQLATISLLLSVVRSNESRK